MDESRTLLLADGRELSYRFYGEPAGRPLHVFHGLPGSRTQAALLHEAALANGVCLVAADRPGFGRSTPHATRSFLSWAGDVQALADHLGHARFGVLGISCGGPYALACAHKMPARLDYVGLLAGIGPMDVPEIRRGQMPFLKVLFGLARVHPWLAAPVLLPDALMFRRNPERAVRVLASMLTPPDRAIVQQDHGVREAFAASLAEAYRQGIGGAMREAHLIANPRGYALEDIRVPVHLYQAGVDGNVPPAMGRYMAQRLPQGHLREYPAEGHLSVVIKAVPDCLRDFRDAF
jgi:pimeloyl-ACP methyl ester carboxylesterase